MQRFFVVRMLAVFAALLVVAGCSEENPVDDGNNNNNGGGDVEQITVTPGDLTIYIGTQVKFTADVVGGDDPSVTWSMESTASEPGTLLSTGIYEAPTSMMEDSIVVKITATSNADDTKSVTVTVVVRATDPEHVVPNEGSSFSFNSYLVNAFDIKDPSSEINWTSTLVQKGVAYAGRNDAVLYTHPIEFTSLVDSTLFVYVSGGNLGITEEKEDGDVWYILPFSGGTDVQIDSDSRTLQNGSTYTLDVKASYKGAELMVLDGDSLRTRRVEMISREVVSGVDNYELTLTENFWYVPALGRIVRREYIDVRLEGSSEDKLGYKERMTGYSLK